MAVLEAYGGQGCRGLLSSTGASVKIAANPACVRGLGPSPLYRGEARG